MSKERGGSGGMKVDRLKVKRERGKNLGREKGKNLGENLRSVFVGREGRRRGEGEREIEIQKETFI